MSEETKKACELLALGIKKHQDENKNYSDQSRQKMKNTEWVQKFCQIELTLPAGRGISTVTEHLLQSSMKEAWTIHSTKWSMDAAKKIPKTKEISSKMLGPEGIYQEKLNWGACPSLIVNGWNLFKTKEQNDILHHCFESSEKNQGFVLFCFNKI